MDDYWVHMLELFRSFTKPGFACLYTKKKLGSVLNESNALLTRMPDVLHPHVGAGGEEEPMDRYKQVANHV